MPEAVAPGEGFFDLAGRADKECLCDRNIHGGSAVEPNIRLVKDWE